MCSCPLPQPQHCLVITCRVSPELRRYSCPALLHPSCAQGSRGPPTCTDPPPSSAMQHDHASSVMPRGWECMSRGVFWWCHCWARLCLSVTTKHTRPCWLCMHGRRTQSTERHCVSRHPPIHMLSQVQVASMRHNSWCDARSPRLDSRREFAGTPVTVYKQGHSRGRGCLTSLAKHIRHIRNAGLPTHRFRTIQRVNVL